ncbi:MAG: hypothetical protein K6C10_02245 [Prevotella sp.]|nr:hypothetical protein [Prevotella sp.]
MKKVYISPVIEIVATRLNEQLMQDGHSFDWADAKGLNFEDEDSDDDTNWSSKNIWDE